MTVIFDGVNLFRWYHRWQRCPLFMGDASQEHEIALSFTGRSFRKDYDSSPFRATLTPSSVITIFSFPTGTQGLVTVYDSDSAVGVTCRL